MLELFEPPAPRLPGVGRRHIEAEMDLVHSELHSERADLHDARLQADADPAHQSEWDVPISAIAYRVRHLVSQLERLEEVAGLTDHHGSPRERLRAVQRQLQSLWKNIEAAESKGHARFLRAMWRRFARIEDRQERPLLDRLRLAAAEVQRLRERVDATEGV